MSSEHKRGGWRTRGSGVAVLVAIAVGYVLSYPPALRFYYGSDQQQNTEGVHPFYLSASLYRPVEWLIDYTPARGSMLWWARVWDVNETVADAARYREIQREILRGSVF